MVNDPSAVPRVLSAIRRSEAQVHVVVRTHYLANRARLMELGAHETIVEEVESGVEIVACALKELGVPRNVLERRMAEAREATLASVRPHRLPPGTLAATALARLSVDSVLVEVGAPAVGRTLVEVALQRETGALCLAIERGRALIQKDVGTIPLEAGDILHLAGTEPALAEAASYLAAPPPEAPSAEPAPA